jgi:hypothetical protein
MKIHNESSWLKPDGIAKVEQMYNAKYVFESCLKTRFGGWSEFPVAIFYTEQAHPEGSNYFGLFKSEFGQLTICNGISALEEFIGLQIGEDIIYSRYRHDYCTLNENEDGGFIDGGRDYVRTNPEIGKLVKLKVVKDKLEVVDERVSN